MRQLSGTDALMLFSESPNAQNVLAPIIIYDPSTAPGGVVSFEDILAHIEARLGASESFREKLVKVPFGLDRPYWVRDQDFDLEYHVRQAALPRPGTWQQFCKLVARIGARRLDMARPPWELYIIEGLDAIEGVPEGAFASMLKLHHAAVDGVAGTEILTAIHDVEGSGGHTPPPAQSWSPEPTPTDLKLLGRAYVNSLTNPRRFVRTVGSAIKDLRGQPAKDKTKDKDGVRSGGLVTATRFNRPVSAHRSWGMKAFPLSDIKAIRTAVADAKVNDVGIALVAGAMRCYLLDKGELPAETLVAVMPISVRPNQIQKEQLGAIVEASTGGNSFAMVPIAMGTDIADPLARIEFIRRRTADAKSRGAVEASMLAGISELMPGALMGSMQRAVTRAVNRFGRTMAAHTLITNVPGPQVPMYLRGARTLLLSGMAPVMDGMGLVNGIGSYAGALPVSFTADRETMPDPEFYEECLVRSFEELKAAASASLGGGLAERSGQLEAERT